MHDNIFESETNNCLIAPMGNLGKIRDELLSGKIFDTLFEAQVIIEKIIKRKLIIEAIKPRRKSRRNS